MCWFCKKKEEPKKEIVKTAYYDVTYLGITDIMSLRTHEKYCMDEDENGDIFIVSESGKYSWTVWMGQYQDRKDRIEIHNAFYKAVVEHNAKV